MLNSHITYFEAEKYLNHLAATTARTIYKLSIINPIAIHLRIRTYHRLGFSSA
ncbi:hypothetical protein DSUL_170046 [Desulfovibrionales bacterium]